MTEDYSFHLIAARKALATAEAQAALHDWAAAANSLDKVREWAGVAMYAMNLMMIEEKS